MTSLSKAIFIALGGNLDSPRFGPPSAILEAALSELEARGVVIAARSAWYATAPVPRSDQPDFVNGVARVQSDLAPDALLSLLHDVEDAFGRVRVIRNEARVLDLDLIDYDGRVEAGVSGPILPHPRAHERGFVLVPLRDVAPGWRHPVSGEGIDALIARLAPGQEARRL